ncbi:MAG TPA: long-chain fatty acid transporter [Crocinitomicaceae bacterium]|nr:long-chain fatty acid transporter [Crocinitomicaceae bacterium]
MHKLLLFLILPIQLLSQGYQVNLQGQVSQGMGGAGSALMQDGSALFFNPGGASFIHKNEISLNVTPTFGNSTFLENNTNSIAHTTSPVGTPFSAYGIFQIKDSSKLKLGMAIYTPFGSTVEWEDEWAGRFALTRLKLLSIFFQPTVSYRLTDKIGIGAGFIYSYGKVNLQKDLPIQDASGEYGHAELDGSGNGIGFNVGLFLDLTKHVNFAITYRSKIDMKVDKGIATFTVPSSLEDKFPSGNFSSSLPLPSVFTFGLGITPNDKLSIAFDGNYTDWTAYDTLSFDYENNTESLDDTKSPRKYVGSIAARLGVQYKATDKITGRIGFTYALSPVIDRYITPETPDANRLNWTIGMGYKISDQFSVDASLLFTQFKREATNEETGLSGTYKTRVWAPGIQINYTLK